MSYASVLGSESSLNTVLKRAGERLGLDISARIYDGSIDTNQLYRHSYIGVQILDVADSSELAPKKARIIGAISRMAEAFIRFADDRNLVVTLASRDAQHRKATFYQREHSLVISEVYEEYLRSAALENTPNSFLIKFTEVL